MNKLVISVRREKSFRWLVEAHLVDSDRVFVKYFWTRSMAYKYVGYVAKVAESNYLVEVWEF